MFRQTPSFVRVEEEKVEDEKVDLEGRLFCRGTNADEDNTSSGPCVRSRQGGRAAAGRLPSDVECLNRPAASGDSTSERLVCALQQSLCGEIAAPYVLLETQTSQNRAEPNEHMVV